MSRIAGIVVKNRRSIAGAVLLVAIVYGVLFVLVSGQIDVPFLYSNPGR